VCPECEEGIIGLVVYVYAINSKRYIRQILYIGQWSLFFDTDAVSLLPQPSK
jgi:hypothetical protein